MRVRDADSSIEIMQAIASTGSRIRRWGSGQQRLPIRTSRQSSWSRVARLSLYGELSDRADQYANFFRRLGFETGDSIAFTLEICPEFFAVCIGALVHCGPDFSISTGALTRTGHDRRSLRKILQQFRLPDSRVIAGFAGHPAGKLQQNS